MILFLLACGPDCGSPYDVDLRCPCMDRTVTTDASYVVCRPDQTMTVTWPPAPTSSMAKYYEPEGRILCTCNPEPATP